MIVRQFLTTKKIIKKQAALKIKSASRFKISDAIKIGNTNKYLRKCA